MSKQFRGTHITQPPRSKDEPHIGNPRYGTALCMSCLSVYDKKSWRHPTERLLQYMKRQRSKKGNPIHFVTCPACSMIREHLYEGMLIVENIPEGFVFELIQLVNSFTERARARDPQHRLIKIEGNQKAMTITTTENQLASRLAKKIKESFKKKFDVHVVFSREPYEKEFARLTFVEPRKIKTTKKKT